MHLFIGWINPPIKRVEFIGDRVSCDTLKSMSFIVYTVHLILVMMGKSRRLKCAGHVARMEGRRSALKILTGKPKGSRYLGRPIHSWEDHIRTILKEINAGTKK